MPSPATKSKDPVIQEHTRLVRFIESNLKVKTDDPTELRFRSSLIRKVESVLPAMNGTFLARIYEAVCAVEFAKPDVIDLRVKCQEAIGLALNLKEFRKPALTNSNR